MLVVLVGVVVQVGVAVDKLHDLVIVLVIVYRITVSFTQPCVHTHLHFDNFLAEFVHHSP